MLNSFKQYFVILGNALIGIAFGYTCFFLLLNVYHYQEIRREAYIDFENDVVIKEIDASLKKIDTNISKFNTSKYNGTLSYGDASKMQRKLKACVSSFRNETFTQIRTDNRINIIDVYNFRKSFSEDILNNCIVFQLYDLTSKDTIDDYFIKDNKKLLKSYMDDLLQDTSYLQKDLDSNSGYYYNTDIVSSMVKNQTRDGFYEVLSSYRRSLKFVELISDWYSSRVGGV